MVLVGSQIGEPLRKKLQKNSLPKKKEDYPFSIGSQFFSWDDYMDTDLMRTWWSAAFIFGITAVFPSQYIKSASFSNNDLSLDSTIYLAVFSMNFVSNDTPVNILIYRLLPVQLFLIFFFLRKDSRCGNLEVIEYGHKILRAVQTSPFLGL